MMAQNKSYKELMELYGAGSGNAGSAGSGGGTAAGNGGSTTSNQMLELILGRKPFQYDANTDPAAKAARKEAALNARATTQDTLGRYAGLTGGMPSTAAVSAAAQAGNQARALGADKVAELEQLAFQNYQTEGQNMYNAYSAMQQSESDTWNRGMQEQQLQYQQDQDDYQNKLNLAQLAAAYGDYSGLEALGIDTSKYRTGGGSYRYTGDGGGHGNEEQPASAGLSGEDYNKLLMLADGNGYLDEATYDQYAAIYGEAELTAKGFRRKQKQQEQPKPSERPATGRDAGTGKPVGVIKGESGFSVYN